MQKASEEKRKKWNFNFNLEKPLDGPLQWEPVGTNRVPVVTLTQAAHVIPGTRRPAGLERSSSSTSSSSVDILSSDELMDQRAERANRGSSVESLDGSLSSLSPAEEEEEEQESVQTYPIMPSSPKKKSAARSQSPKPSSSKGSKLRQPQITGEFVLTAGSLDTFPSFCILAHFPLLCMGALVTIIKTKLIIGTFALKKKNTKSKSYHRECILLTLLHALLIIFNDRQLTLGVHGWCWLVGNCFFPFLWWEGERICISFCVNN